MIGDLLAAQRVMTQKTFERVRRIELDWVAPSHYEPGRAARHADDEEPRRAGRTRASRAPERAREAVRL